jgi:hypothetical protein
MCLATLRVEGADSSLEQLKNELSLACDLEWRKGDRRRNNSLHTLSGFNANVGECENPQMLTSLIRSFLKKWKEKAVVLSRLNLKAELDIGFSVGSSEQYVASVLFTSDDLLLCAECGINLRVTAFPTSDEANAQDDIQENGEE